MLFNFSLYFTFCSVILLMLSLVFVSLMFLSPLVFQMLVCLEYILGPVYPSQLIHRSEKDGDWYIYP